MEIKRAVTPASPSCAEIVADLDRYIVGQAAAKRAVAIALRNRWRRMQLPEDVRREVVPNNIIMIGPTGVGKTEIARRLAQIAGLPFLKAEASKFTERGYVGRDVDSLIRDLVENGIAVVRQREEALQRETIDQAVEERLVDLLFPPLADDDPERRARWERSRDRIREQLRTGVLEDSKVSIVTEQIARAHRQHLHLGRRGVRRLVRREPQEHVPQAAQRARGHRGRGAAGAGRAGVREAPQPGPDRRRGDRPGGAGRHRLPRRDRQDRRRPGPVGRAGPT